MPGDLAEKFDMAKKVPLQRVGDHQELANWQHTWFLISAYINGEVVVIDGGECAGQFNMLEAIPEELWDQLEMMIKAKKNN
jgi:NAD(P)-dependent dehydrogenase (short-subunit alcohol dehydrogenase family)